MRLVYIIITLTLLACDQVPRLGPGTEELLATAAQSDCGFIQNAFGQRVSWKNKTPVILKVDNTFPQEYVKALDRAASHWNEAAGTTLVQIQNATSIFPEKPRKDGINTIVWQHTWPETMSNTQGLTNLYWRGSQLAEADISINDFHFDFFDDTPFNLYQVHIESLLIHEIGHVLGLKHRSSIPSVMWAALGASTKRDALTSADRETIKCEY